MEPRGGAESVCWGRGERQRGDPNGCAARRRHGYPLQNQLIWTTCPKSPGFICSFCLEVQISVRFFVFVLLGERFSFTRHSFV